MLPRDRMRTTRWDLGAGMKTPAQEPRYRTLDMLGMGGTARVQRCFDTELGRFVARKTPLTRDQIAADHLMSEARLMAFLDHPGVVPIYSVDPDEKDGIPSYTMKVLTGLTLADRMENLRADGRLMPISEAVDIFTRVAQTMANAHDKGVLHLDLKPANVVLQSLGHVVVIDWGVAWFHDTRPYAAHLAAGGSHVEPGKVQMPIDAAAAGTAPYMSLEQLTWTRDRLGPPADIFSMGVILYRMLTGHRPYPRNGEVQEHIDARLNILPHPVHHLRADVSHGLSQICHRMIAVDPQDRFQTFRQVLDALRDLSDVAENALLMELDEGEILFEEGEPSGAVYQVLEGEMQVTIDVEGQRTLIATLGVGEILGELAMLSNQARSARVHATKPTLVREMTPELIQQELDKVHPLVGHIVRSLSDRLIKEVDAKKSK